MADMRLSDFVRAQATMDGAMNEKEMGDKTLDIQQIYEGNIGAYGKYGLHTVFSILAVTIALFLVIFESLWFLLLLPIIYYADYYYNLYRKRKLYNKKIDYFEMREKENPNTV